MIRQPLGTRPTRHASAENRPFPKQLDSLKGLDASVWGTTEA